MDERDINKVKVMLDSGLSQYKIANIFNTTQTTVSRFIKKYGIEYELEKGKMSKDDVDAVRDMYYNRGMLQSEIGKEFGVSQPTISDFMYRYNIKANRSDRISSEEDINIYEDWLKCIPISELTDKYNHAIKTIRKCIDREYNKRGGI